MNFLLTARIYPQYTPIQEKWLNGLSNRPGILKLAIYFCIPRKELDGTPGRGEGEFCRRITDSEKTTRSGESARVLVYARTSSLSRRLFRTRECRVSLSLSLFTPCACHATRRCINIKGTCILQSSRGRHYIFRSTLHRYALSPFSFPHLSF